MAINAKENIKKTAPQLTCKESKVSTILLWGIAVCRINMQEQSEFSVRNEKFWS
ncbi:hypothetical protein [Aquimarina sp. Aq78]|uniref:hypothetical protein n=1 Tax=Aquimarina sp. Aq78 TaxID=1191889 RepID=UPI00131E34DE|nr:hypothetical protein [Aquimarina sp. Aq78]